jgi:hypothetical protein
LVGDGVGVADLLGVGLAEGLGVLVGDLGVELGFGLTLVDGDGLGPELLLGLGLGLADLLGVGLGFGDLLGLGLELADLLGDVLVFADLLGAGLVVADLLGSAVLLGPADLLGLGVGVALEVLEGEAVAVAGTPRTGVSSAVSVFAFFGNAAHDVVTIGPALLVAMAWANMPALRNAKPVSAPTIVGLTSCALTSETSLRLSFRPDRARTSCCSHYALRARTLLESRNSGIRFTIHSSGHGNRRLACAGTAVSLTCALPSGSYAAFRRAVAIGAAARPEPALRRSAGPGR